TLAAANYAFAFGAGTLSVTPAPLTITANSASKTYGQALTFAGTEFTTSGLVNGDTVTGVTLTSAGAAASAAVAGSPYPITASAAAGTGLGNYSITYANGSLTVAPATLTVTANSVTRAYGQSNPPLTYTITGYVNGETASVVSGAPALTTAATATSPSGTYPILVSQGTLAAANYVFAFVNGTLTISPSILILDPTAGAALSLSGNGSIQIAGSVFVDSRSANALQASGSASLTAAGVQVVGGVQRTGSATITTAPATGAAPLADPLSGLGGPSPTGLTNYGSVTITGGARTLSPGIYSRISISGSASVTLNPGVYLIEGGGFTVSGGASVSGNGILIVNAGSNYPSAGSTYGPVILSGSGTISLTAPATGTYAGVVLLQPAGNTKALTFSGGAGGLTGTVYAPSASLVLSGNARLRANLVVDTLAVSGNSVANGVTLDAPAGTVSYTPADVRSAYGIDRLALDGAGQTIAFVDAYGDPALYESLDAFDGQFGLTASGPTLYDQYGPAASFLTVLNQDGQPTSLPATDPNGPGPSNWEIEEALDVEWAHAVAPGAQILLVQANSQSLADLMAAVATAARQPGVSVVSMSWGFPEGQAVFAQDEALYDGDLTTPPDHPGVVFVASTGDYGSADPEYPAFSPQVVAVGGTSLYVHADGSYNTETAWGQYSSALGEYVGSGGGGSLYEPEPAFQRGVQSTGSRSTPDVSLVADPGTGAWVADTYNLPADAPFKVVGGTSLSAPAWAGLFALVNQGRAAAGAPALNSVTATDAQQALYGLTADDFHAVGGGYNTQTGLGTPAADRLVPGLVAYQEAGDTYTYATP
ncbi:MAG TPA: MBG domain-containing protein, partial [Gemmataceae bacterium]|nr:MBG domain-containing protein [Gemmataceae bacterium]